jgi:hypothetical protein
MSALLPAWSEYSTRLGLHEKEPVENFDWMQNNREWFMDVKYSLDHVQGSRDWLRNTKIDWHSDETFNRVFAMLKMRDLHSGGSIVSLLSSYSECLKDWDAWVKATKTSYVWKRYTAEQLPWGVLFTLVTLVERMEGGGLPGSDFHQIHREFLELKRRYNILGTNDEAIAMIRAVWAEMEETAKKIESGAPL